MNENVQSRRDVLSVLASTPVMASIDLDDVTGDGDEDERFFEYELSHSPRDFVEREGEALFELYYDADPLTLLELFGSGFMLKLDEEGAGEYGDVLLFGGSMTHSPSEGTKYPYRSVTRVSDEPVWSSVKENSEVYVEVVLRDWMKIIENPEEWMDARYPKRLEDLERGEFR